ncbi:hypothetical protein ACLGIH_20545 [Streptomyces sp. HMX87]|uniref:hypothetical protein n=1 Tax=Streptomyces sp. HMX87 TaxID=3390849 RepID=UPI003A89DCBF
MAQRLVTEQFCDWHGQLDQPQQVPAVHVRTNPHGKDNDLCEACCMMFDWGMPRVETLMAFFNPEVIKRLLRVGREPAEAKSERRSAQLALPGAAPASKAVPTPKKEKTKKTTTPDPESVPESNARKSAIANRGRWKPDVDQVLCPLDHKGANSPKRYWVDVRDRGSHAKSSHKGLRGPQVPYELPPDANFTLDVKCFDHKVCAEAGGFGFKTPAGLAMHITKADAEGWEKASSKDTTTTD